MGLQRAVANAEDIESISKARHDRDGAAAAHNDDDDELLTATQASYDSWLVSYATLSLPLCVVY